MPKLSAADLATIAELSVALQTVRIDEPAPLEPLLAEVRRFLELDTLLVFCPQERLTGWGLERLDLDNFPNRTRFVARFTEFLARAPYRFWSFDPVNPEPEQRDSVLESIREPPRGSLVHSEVLAPLNLDHWRQLRSLVCDERSLLGWVGSLHDGPIESHHRLRLAAMLPAFRGRLAADRMLRSRVLCAASLELALDELAGAAYLLGPHGRIVATNRSGREDLDVAREETVEILAAAAAGRAHDVGAECAPVRGNGVPPCTLVRTRANTAETHIETCVGRVADRWRLTTRQREVLELVTRGLGNWSIASRLGIGERTVELHITAILDRAGVDSRAMLVSRILSQPAQPWKHQ